MVITKLNYQRSWKDKVQTCLLIIVMATTSFNLNEVKAATTSDNQASNSAINPNEGLDISVESVTLVDDLQKKLDDTSKELAAEQTIADNNQAIRQDGELPRPLLLQMLIHNYESLLQRVKDLQDKKQKFVEWQKNNSIQSKQNTSSSTFITQDEFRESLEISHKRLARLNQMADYVEQETEHRIQLANQMAAVLRQVYEKLEQSDAADKASSSEEIKTVILKYRGISIRVLATQIERKRIQQDILEINAQRDLAKKQYANLQTAQMTEQDLQLMHKKIQTEKGYLSKEIEKTVSEFGRDRMPVSSSQVTIQPQNIDVLRDALKKTGDFKLQILHWMSEQLQFRQLVWEYRWSYLAVNDHEKARKAYEQIGDWQKSLQLVHEYMDQLRLLALDNSVAQSIDSSSTSDLQSLDIERVKILSRLLVMIETNEHLVRRCQEDLDQRFKVKSQLEYWNEVLLTVRDIANDVLRYELFVAEDIVEVDGQQIKGKRSITVSKIVIVLLILIVGYWLAVKIAFLIEKIVVKHFAADPGLARISRRWFLFAELILLACISMFVVHIPLSVFAFMGGAIAIGAGFGMQNLLKNLISGLMLLLERPFRPGDLVEVGGVRGRIIDIGVRSSQIRDGNGIETLIPNSTFIEEKVTNWTLNSQSVRIAVKVGVAYGSSIQDVTEILLKAAERHGLVQDKPAPQVLLEDFGSDALLFGLYVWLELKPGVDWSLVASDLRIIINKKFIAQGITIASPQRDVHIDLKQPLAVQVLNDS